MSKSKIYLPDINVWVALASDRHVHHDLASLWFASVKPAAAAFGRITQMGFLRLITNSRVMGEDVLSQRRAWLVYEMLQRDNRVTFVGEPATMEEDWKKRSQSQFPGVHAWTDAYLAAFARGQNLCVVSFDRDFKKWADVDFISLL